MTPEQELAQEILDFWTPEKFSIGKMAETEEGYWTLPSSPTAVKWCAFGVIAKFAGMGSPGSVGGKISEKADRIAHQKYNSNLVSVNDRKGYKAVRSIFEAIAKETLWQKVQRWVLTWM